MFGYVTANVKTLEPDDLKIYKGLYCGLCRTLKERHGSISRASLTYDMTFLILVLSSLYNTEDVTGEERCLVHPKNKHFYMINKFSDYAADMNIALFYNKMIDDWNDDKSLKAKATARFYRKNYAEIQAKYPRQCMVMENCLKDLSDIESKGILNVDIPANIFGRLLSEIFIFEEDQYSDVLRKAAADLGRFIYVMDAWDDLKDDIKKERYNPLTVLPTQSIEPVLTMLIADCSEALFSLPLNKNINILKNIVYSGVWLRYAAKKNIKSSQNR